jgi:uncharacterized membrane protein YeiH
MQSLEILGTAAFAISGAMIAIDKGADIFGVLFLSLITALGGGVIRDTLLGNTPPVMFTSYMYVTVALVCGLAIFILAWTNIERYAKLYPRMDNIVNIFDALGLAAFTVTGVDLTVGLYGLNMPLLLCLMGMCTAVGGGMLRDVLTNSMPMVLTSPIYAVASLGGALMYYILLSNSVPNTAAALITCVLIFALRMMATVFNWNLPKVRR